MSDGLAEHLRSTRRMTAGFGYPTPTECGLYVDEHLISDDSADCAACHRARRRATAAVGPDTPLYIRAAFERGAQHAFPHGSGRALCGAQTNGNWAIDYATTPASWATGPGYEGARCKPCNRKALAAAAL